jgi:hypothetical protein
MPAWLHLASRGAVVALHVTGLTKRESEMAKPYYYPF